MAARPTWKGYIKVSLVTIPVQVYPATESSATISFNQLHADCQTKIQQKKWCPKCEIELTQAEIVKGYEFEKGRWVVVEEEDIAKVKTESTKIINLLQFTDADAIDPMYVDKAYYLAPEGADGRRRLFGDARRHAGQGRHRQGRDSRPRVPGRRQAAQAGHGDVHAASRRRDPHHRSDRRAARSARQGQPGRDEAGASR